MPLSSVSTNKCLHLLDLLIEHSIKTHMAFLSTLGESNFYLSQSTPA